MPAKGQHHTDDTKYRMAQAQHERWDDDEVRQAQGDALKARWQDPEFRAKMAAGRRRAAEARKVQRQLSELL